MRALKKRSKKAWQAAETQIDAIAKHPYLGEELEEEWAGARAVHFGRDAYRLIWEVVEKEEVLWVLLVGAKKIREGTIYSRQRPTTDQWPPSD